MKLVDRIAAGVSLLADEMVGDVYRLHRQIVCDGDLFALTVSGGMMSASGNHKSRWASSPGR